MGDYHLYAYLPNGFFSKVSALICVMTLKWVEMMKWVHI